MAIAEDFEQFRQSPTAVADDFESFRKADGDNVTRDFEAFRSGTAKAAPKDLDEGTLAGRQAPAVRPGGARFDIGRPTAKAPSAAESEFSRSAGPQTDYSLTPKAPKVPKVSSPFAASSETPTNKDAWSQILAPSQLAPVAAAPVSIAAPNRQPVKVGYTAKEQGEDVRGFDVDPSQWKPEDFNGGRGYGQMAEGFRDYRSGAVYPEDFSSEEAAKASRSTGLTKVLTGAMEAAKPALAAAGATAPVPLLQGLGLGVVTGKAAGKVAEMAGASPETSQLAETAGFLAPSAAGVLGVKGGISRGVDGRMTGMVRAFGESPVVNPETGEPIIDPRTGQPATEPRVAAGFQNSPEGFRAGVKAGDQRFAVGIERPQPSAMEVQAARESQDAVAAMARSHQAEEIGEAMVNGGPVAPPQAPPKPIPGGAVTHDVLNSIGQTILQVPEAQRPQAMIQAHDEMTKALLQQGKVIDPDGKLQVIETPQQASKLAQTWLNNKVDEFDKQQSAVSGQQSETNTPAAPASEVQNPKGLIQKMRDRMVGAKAERVVEESRATVDKQVEALKDGNIGVVFLPAGSEYVPKLPDGFRRADVDEKYPGGGVYYFDPAQHTAKEIKQAAKEGTHGELLGHMQSKAEIAQAPASVVVQTRAKDGTPIQDSEVDASRPEIIQAQKDLMAARHPNASIEVRPTDEVLQERVRSTQYSVPSEEQAAAEAPPPKPEEAKAAPAEPPQKGGLNVSGERRAAPRSETSQVFLDKLHRDLRSAKNPEERAQIQSAIDNEKQMARSAAETTEVKNVTNVQNVTFSPKPAKGDLVDFTGRDGAKRTGTLRYTGDLVARVETADGTMHKVAPSKVIGKASVEDFEAHREARAPLSERLKDLPAAERAYDALGTPDYVAADKVKELAPGWEKKEDRAKLDTEIHGDASRLAYELFRSKLARLAPGSDVALITGPVAAGKTSAFESLADRPDLTYEANLSDQAHAEDHINSILSQGAKPTILYVYNTASGSAERRAFRMMRDGRPVGIDRSTGQHMVLPRSVENLAKKYGDQLKVRIIDNSKKGEPATEVPIENIQSLRYAGTKDELLREQQAELDRLRAGGHIPSEVHQALSSRVLRPSYEAGAGRIGEGSGQAGEPTERTGTAEQRQEQTLKEEPPEAKPKREYSATKVNATVTQGERLFGKEGRETSLSTPSGRMPARYRLIESDSLIPSHNAVTFHKNDAYPEGVQERAYDASKEAQNRVIQQSQNYDPAYTINSNPDAINGPPIITPDGVVLGGNSRAMSTQRLYQSGGDAYKAYLKEHAATFGFDKEAVDALQNPVLVREVDAPKDVESLRRLGSELNKSMTGALGVSERAVSAGKSIRPESLTQIASMLDDLGDSASLRDLMRERGREVVSLLTRDRVITERERPQFVDTSTGGLSEEGKTFVERALLGSVVDDPRLMDATPKSMLNKLDGSLGDIASLSSRTDEYNVLPVIREALEEHAEVARRGTDLELHLGQSGMFGPQRNPAVDAMVRLLGKSTKAVRLALREFAQDAKFDQQGQATLALGTQPSAVESFNHAFGTKFSEEEYTDSLLDALKRSEYDQEGKAGSAAKDLQSVPSGEAPRGREAGAREAGSEAKSELASDLTNPDRRVPGARSAYTGDETNTTSIRDLTDAIARQVPQKASLKGRLAVARELAVADSPKDAITRTLAKAQAGFAALIDAYKRPPSWTEYEDATGKWVGADQVNSLDLYRFTEEIQKAVPDRIKRDAISNWIEAGGDEAVLRSRAEKSQAPYKAGYEAALKLTDAEQTIARNVMSRNDATLKEAQEAGLMQAGVENYVRHLYKDDPKMQQRIASEMNFSSLQTAPGFTKQRKLPTYFDAEQLGFQPKNKDVGFLTASHERSFREALAARDYIRALMQGKAKDGRPLVITDPSTAREMPATDEKKNAAYAIRPNVGPDDQFGDYRMLDHWALRGWKWVATINGSDMLVQGNALVHPEIFRHLKNNLTTSALRNYEMTIGDKTFKPGQTLLDAQANVKHAVLSFSGFHQTTLGIHGMEHRIRPALLPKLDLNDPVQKRLVDHGLMVAHYDAEEAFGEGVASGGVMTQIPIAGPLYHQYLDYLFRSYLPRLKMEMATHALDRNVERYRGKLNDDQIYALTARQANAAFGGLNYKLLGRNKTFQDVLRLSLMAPDFLEARARFVGQAAKPHGAEQLQALLLGALVLYTAARILNQMTDHDPHWGKAFSVVIGGKEFHLRTIQEDLYDAVTDPGRFTRNRLSPLASAGLNFVAPEGKSKKEKPLAERLKKAAGSVAPIPAQPWLRKSDDSNAQKAAESILKVAGVNVRDVKK